MLVTFRSIVAACSAVAAVAVFALPATAGAQVPLPAVQHTLRIFGCDVQPNQIQIRARRVHDVNLQVNPGPPNDQRAQTPSAGAYLVTPVPTSVPGDFTFQFDGLSPTDVYRLGIKLIGQTAQRCPNLAWHSSRETLFRASDPPLEVAGFALLSEFAVLATDPGRNSQQWLGREAVRFFDPAASTRTFRWRSSVPGANGGTLQIADQPFPKPGDDPTEFDPCETEGVLYSREFQAAASGWTDIGAINFHQLLTDPDRHVSPATAVKLELGMPLYVRVMPTMNGRMLCDPREAGAPAEVILANLIPFVVENVNPGPALTLKHVEYYPPWIDPKHPKWGVTERCYRVIKPHAPSGSPPFWNSVWDLYLGVKGLAGNVGDRFCAVESSGDDGWFESLTSTVSSFVSKFIDGVGALVDFAANTWDSIQDTVVDGVASGINAAGIVDCDAFCRQALRTGLEIALASMGVPPSLPNFDELQQVGLDYAAQQLAEQTGVPGPIADLATQKAKQFVDSAM